MGAGALSQKLMTLRVLIAPYCQIPQSVITVVFAFNFFFVFLPLSLWATVEWPKFQRAA